MTKDDSPKQPLLPYFPKNEVKRSFNSNNYKLYNWIEYSVMKDMVYCFVCRHFSVNKCFTSQTAGCVVFVDLGFKNWRKQTECFKKHLGSERHKTCYEKWTMYLVVKQNENSSINNLLVHSRIQEVKENRQHIYFLLKASLYLSKQGLAFRGHNEKEDSINKGNFIEILETFGDEKLKTKLNTRYGHYTSHEYQNDLISVIAKCTKENILKKISNLRAYSILVDETKDASKKEQLSFIIRFIDQKFNIYEKALGCFHMEKCDAQSLSQEIFKIIAANNLDINKCIGQCYDGASVMSGKYSGVQQRISNIIPHAIYVHCYAHRLNLCLINTIQNIPLVVNFFNTVQDLYKFLMNGNTRYELFVEAQKQKQIKILHLERLVETRWAYWYTSLEKIENRYTEIKEVLSILTTKGDQTARASGLLNEISSNTFILILVIMKEVLKAIHCVSCEFQNASIILSAAINLINTTKNELLLLRTDVAFIKMKEKAMLYTKKNVKKDIRNKRSFNYNKKLDDYYVESTIGKSGLKQTCSLNIKQDILYVVIDR